MRAIVLFLLILMGTPALSRATEIEGKWGLGVSVGNLLSSGAEASLICGKSARTAWIADCLVNVVRDDRNSITNYQLPYYPDTTIAGDVTSEFFSIDVGPRLRHFLRPESQFSPYWDVFLHFFDLTRRQTYVDRTTSEVQVGGKIGVSLGAEYFSTRWPVSLAAHTDLTTFSASYASNKSNDPSRTAEFSGTILSGSLTLRPILQVRVYF